MSEPFVSSRFLIRERCVAYPYFDIHNQDSQGPVFDLGVDLDSYDGTVYVRPEYVIDMARTLGMATVDEVATMRATIASLESKINKLPKAQEELKSGLDAVVASFYASLDSDDSADQPALFGDSESESDNREPETPERKADGPLIL